MPTGLVRNASEKRRGLHSRHDPGITLDSGRGRWNACAGHVMMVMWPMVMMSREPRPILRSLPCLVELQSAERRRAGTTVCKGTIEIIIRFSGAMVVTRALVSSWISCRIQATYWCPCA